MDDTTKKELQSATLERLIQHLRERKDVQNIDLMNALSIKPGWSKNEKWPDGTDVDDYSIVDWLKYGMGINSGISKDASKEARTYLYNKYVKSN